MVIRSSSVNLPHFSLTLPVKFFQFPWTWSQFMIDSLKNRSDEYVDFEFSRRRRACSSRSHRHVSLARPGSLPRGSRAGRARPRRRSGAAFLPTFPGRSAIDLFALSGTTFLAAAVGLVDRGPSTPLGFFFRNSVLLVAFFNMFGLTLLLAAVLRFVASCHWSGPLSRLFEVLADKPASVKANPVPPACLK